MRILFALIATSLLLPTGALAEPLQLCVKADRFVEGKPREGTKIVLRSQCKVRSNGTLIEISLGTSDVLGSGMHDELDARVQVLEALALEASCGDGQLDLVTGEQCDDGGLMEGDGCSALCQIEEGWECEGRTSDCGPVCGDGILRSPEVCDDGNTTDEDGCSAACEIESGWSCNGSVCSEGCAGETSNPGDPCNDGSACTASDVCSGGICLGTDVGDQFEENDTQGTANLLGYIDDSMSFPSGTFEATVFGEADEDWYFFRVEDRTSGIFGPRVDLSNVPASATFSVCAFADCVGGGTISVDCDAGSESVAPSGLSGCCSDTSVILDVDCVEQADETSHVYVRVQQTSGSATCDAYRLEWGDN